MIKMNQTVKACLILALAIVIAYSPIIFLNQSYNQTIPNHHTFPDLQASVYYPSTIDPAADFEAIHPLNKLAATLFLEGDIPLWNPYIAGGQPLAADTIAYAFSPLVLGFLLPTQLYDVPLLVALWFAGFFTFLLLRSFGLNFLSSITGGIFYMLSGAFTWYLPHTHIPVMVATPFILYSLEKITSSKNPKYVILLSIAFLISILGAHLESIILQFILVGLYFCYRIIYPTLLIYHQKRIHKSSNNQLSILSYDVKRILTWSILGFICGLGLNAFFILPVHEFISNSALGRNSVIGLSHGESYFLTPTFIPYAYGPLQSYWSLDIGGYWNSLPGYIGISTLFFSILGILLSFKIKNSFHKYTPIFFLALSIFFMLKNIGFPGINLIGSLPILELIAFNRYSGVIIPLGFVISAAFGINLLDKIKESKNLIMISLIISILIVLLFSTLLFPLLFNPTTTFCCNFSFNTAIQYYSFQVLQAILIAFMTFLIIVRVNNISAISYIIPFILLELSIYIWVGLPPIWMFYKSVILLFGMSIITYLVFKKNNSSWNLSKPKNITYLIIGILIISVFGGVLISYFSPGGMFPKYDSFQKDPVIDFLKENLSFYRIFSFDYALAPNYPAAYKINTIGVMGAFNIYSFYTFNHNFLDQDAFLTNLGYNPWSYTYKPLQIIDKLSESKKYFDFLGVKYFTSSINLNDFMPGPPGADMSIPITSSEKNIVQEFKSPFEQITAISIQLATHGQKQHGDVILTLDTLPYNEIYHRESIVNTENIIDGAFQRFEFEPLNDINNVQFISSLKFIPSTTESHMATWYYNDKHSPPPLNEIKNSVGGELRLNNSTSSGILAFYIHSDKFKSVFEYNGFNIYENPDVFPRVYLVNEFQLADYDKAQELLLQNPSFDLRHKVILEDQLSTEYVNLLKSSILDENSIAKIDSYSANKVIIKTNSTSASLLVLTDTYYPGWKAFVDGKETQIYRADGLVRAVFVPAGEHTVEFSYMPRSFVIGLTITIITTGILIGLFVYSKRKEQINGSIQS